MAASMTERSKCFVAAWPGLPSYLRHTEYTEVPLVDYHVVSKGAPAPVPCWLSRCIMMSLFTPRLRVSLLMSQRNVLCREVPKGNTSRIFVSYSYSYIRKAAIMLLKFDQISIYLWKNDLLISPSMIIVQYGDCRWVSEDIFSFVYIKHPQL